MPRRTNTTLNLTGGATHTPRNPKPSHPVTARPAPDQPDLFNQPAPPPTHLTPDEAPLTSVPLSAFTGTTRPDAFLYFLTDMPDIFLSEGLPLSTRLPHLLAERTVIPAWLQHLTETEDIPARHLTVLRVRRTLVAPWLEPDPDHSAQFDAPCYLLTGKP